MRYINTKKNFVQLVEADDNGKILSSRGFQFGELYFQIKNKKVTFYLNDSEVPYRNDIWTVNIPLQINDEVYDDEESASDALGEIMNDSFQEQLDELKEGLAAEEARAATAEDALDTKIDNESARAISAETHLQDEITALSGTVATFDERITRNTNDISALTNTVNAEIARSTAKDAEHDTAISGLTNNLASEVSRALSAETEIANDLDAEIVDRQADVDAEEARAISAETGLHNDIVAERDRALAAESGITANLNAEVSRATTRENAIDDKVDAEVTRATAKDTEHDSLISGLTNNLASEVSRAISAETEIANDLDQEIADRAADVDAEEARAISAETGLHNEILAEQTRATTRENAIDDKVDAEVTRATAKDAEHDTAISGLTTNLASEVSRALSAETGLHNEILAEQSRAISAETGLHNDIVAERDRALAAESGIATNLNAEVSRATAKDAEHDASISGLTTSLQNEITRALSAETEIANDLDQEIADRVADVNAEETRALAAESALTDAINAEVTRSTNKDASQDALISGLSTSIQNEITRATGAENSLRNDFNAEVSARTTADAAQLQRITALEVGKADANSVYTKQESDDKYATKEYMSGFSANYYDKNATNALLDAKADKANAVASAEYLSNNKIINFKNISGTVISSIDATAFIKDGMVDTVSISGSNLVITFNTDAGKEPISIPLTDIFNPDNYYTKSEVNSIEDAQNSKINEISGKTDDVASEIQILSGEVQTISGESVTTGEVQTMIDESISGKADSNNVYSKTESDNKYQLKGDYVTGAQMSAFTYTKSEVNGLVADKADTTALTQVNNALTAHTSDANVHVTSSEKSTWNAKQNVLTPGTGISIQNDVISVTATSPTVDAYTKAESDAKFATITNFNSHSGNTNIHVTASEKSTWNNKSDFSGNYNDLTNKPTIPNYTAGSGITISNNVISAKIWSGTLAQYNALSTKDADTIYLIYNS